MRSMLLIIAVLSADVDASSERQSAQEPHRPLNLQIWDGYFNAKSNLRYHLAEAANCGWWDRTLRGTTLLLSVLALTGPIVYSKVAYRWLWGVLGIIAFVASSSLFIWPFGDWRANDTIAASRWNQVANQWYALYEEQQSLSEDAIRERLVELRREVVAIEDDEDASRFDKDKMQAAQNAEREYQGIKQATSSPAEDQSTCR